MPRLPATQEEQPDEQRRPAEHEERSDRAHVKDDHDGCSKPVDAGSFLFLALRHIPPKLLLAILGFFVREN